MVSRHQLWRGAILAAKLFAPVRFSAATFGWLFRARRRAGIFFSEGRMTFDQAFDLLMGHEGGYSNHPSDPGGETMWGITARVARLHGYSGPMRYLPRESAKAIARVEYWNAVRAEELPAAVRFDAFDTAYNSGVKQGIKLLQRAAAVQDDGVLGPKTLAAVRAMPAAKLVLRFNAERLQFLTGLPTWASFGRGWARRVANNLETAAENV